VRVLVADDDADTRSAIRLLLDEEPDLNVAADCETVVGLVERVQCSQSDVVLIDWDLAGDELQRLRAAVPDCRVVALSCRPEQQAQALRGGADSFVCKGDPPEALLQVLRGLR
jgi:DNA-binding NarL/FixJ family response regulator